MRRFRIHSLFRGGLPVILLGLAVALWAAGDPDIASFQRQANGETLVKVARPAGQYFRLEGTDDPGQWRGIATMQAAGDGTAEYLDGSAKQARRKFYRAVPLAGTGIITGDHLATANGDVVIHPVNHASFVMTWNGLTIYSDPVDTTPSRYTGLPRADVILVTHNHGDHFNSAAINALRNTTACKIFAPQPVYNGLSTTLKALTAIVKTGQTDPLQNTAAQTHLGITVEGVPAYNANHTLGSCNSYVLTMGGKRIFISGDTGNTAEMRVLTNIDAAFVCMNIPFTMSIADAVTAVRAFKPKVVYPYHFRNQDNSLADLEAFKQQVAPEPGIEVRKRTWY